jgi:carboxymethylenebutenolidase
MGRMISYNRPDGQSVVGYLAEATKATGSPGMVVIQGWCGLNESRSRALRTSWRRPGFWALVPNL